MGSLMAGWNSPLLGTKRESVYRCSSFTRKEIDNFWRTKRLVEELYEFAKQLMAENQGKHLKSDETGEEYKDLYEEEETTVIGIKDWWTKSSHAFLNQPPLKSMEENPTEYSCNYKYRYESQYHVANIC